MAVEQFFSAKFLAEKIRSEQGKELRRKAGEIKEMIEDAIRDQNGFMGSSVKAMDEFLNAALLMKEKTKKGLYTAQ
ncbi:hypothetical protein CsSME_00050063 [Camellia sinensis var. sinensis]